MPLRNIDEEELGVRDIHIEDEHDGHHPQRNPFVQHEELSPQKKKAYNGLLGAVFGGAIVASIVLAIIVSVQKPDEILDHVQAFNNVTINTWNEFSQRNPHMATIAGLDVSKNDKWPDLSLAAYESELQQLKKIQKTLSKIDRSQLVAHGSTRNQQLDYDLLKRFIDLQYENIEKKLFLLPVTQMTGPQVDVFRYFAAQDQSDLTRWVTRLETLPKYIEQVIDLMKEGVKVGITTPKVILPRVLRQVEGVMEPETANQVFFVPFVSLKSDNPLKLRARSAIDSQVIPAFQSLYDYINSTYSAAARSTIGCKDLSNGADLYRSYIDLYTSTTETPDQIRDAGQTYMSQTKIKLLDYTDSLNLTNVADLKAFGEFLRKNQTTFSSASEYIVHLRDIAKRADPLMPKIFKKMPSCPYGITKYEISQIFPFLYVEPALDCSRAGALLVNANFYSHSQKYMHKTSIIKTVFGNHMLSSLQNDMSVSNIRKFYQWPSFVEGWALYAVSQVAETGFYEDNVLSTFGAMSADYLASLRVYLDTSIHDQNWTRDQAVAYVEENTHLDNAEAEAEVDRIIALPGQALSAKMGEATIARLRRDAEAKLGHHFNEKDFNRIILSRGSLPLGILESYVTRDIESLE